MSRLKELMEINARGLNEFVDEDAVRKSRDIYTSPFDLRQYIKERYPYIIITDLQKLKNK